MIISVSKTRKIMGKAVKKYTDKQLEEVVNALTVLADLAIDDYLVKQGTKKEKTQINSFVTRSNYYQKAQNIS